MILGMTMFGQMIAMMAVLIFTANHFWPEITQIAEKILYLTPVVAYFKNFLKFNIATGLTSLVEYFKSFIGTFVWGHSYFPDVYYWVSFFLCLWLIFQGLCLIAQRYSTRSRIIILTLFSLFLTFQIISVFIAFNTYHSMPAILIASYLKIRLTAPAVAGFVGLLLIGISNVMKRETHSKYFFKLLWIWTLAMLIYFYPDFYWADAF